MLASSHITALSAEVTVHKRSVEPSFSSAHSFVTSQSKLASQKAVLFLDDRVIRFGSAIFSIIGVVAEAFVSSGITQKR